MKRSKCGVADISMRKRVTKSRMSTGSWFSSTLCDQPPLGIEGGTDPLKEEGLIRFLHATANWRNNRKAVQGWNLEMNALHSHEFRDSLTAVGCRKVTMPINSERSCWKISMFRWATALENPAEVFVSDTRRLQCTDVPRTEGD